MARVLVVDDDEANRDLVVTLLRYRGHVITQAADGGQALAIIRAERPDLVISDLLMPVMDGYELVREIRGDRSLAATPVIFYTANYRRDEVQPMATGLGVRDFVSKPIDPPQFLRTVERSLSLPTVAPPLPSETFQREHRRTLSTKLLDKVHELAVAEDALRESEARFRSLSESSPIGIFALTSTGRITYANPRMREISGISVAGDDDPASWLDVLPEGERRRVVVGVGRALRRRVNYVERLHVVRPDGQQRWVQMQIAPVVDASQETTFVGTVEDITGVVEANRERAQMERRLQMSERLESLGQLAAGIAHDFNNLLGVILNYAQFVQAGLAELATEQPGPRWDQLNGDVSAVQEAAERAAQLTRQLLMFARRDVAHPEVVHLNDVVRASMELLGRAIGAHVRFELKLADELWPVCLDRGQFEQVLVNLVVNARDAVGEGGVVHVATDNVELTEQAAALHGAVRAGRYVRLRVTDDGVGMSADTIARAFEPFFTTKPTGAGTGLGLSSAYGIVAQLGGTVTIESQVGVGTSVVVLVPEWDQPVDIAAHSDPQQSAHLPSPDVRPVVLVTDDDQQLRAIAARVLTDGGYDVRSADGGPAALELLADDTLHFDLLLTDVVMPVMSGRYLAERAVQLRPGLPVLFMSGYADGLLDEASSPGFELLQKPFTANALVSAVSGAIRTGT